MFADAAVLGVVPLYLLAFAWLAHRWTGRHRRASHGHGLGAGLLRIVSAVTFLAPRLLFAAALDCRPLHLPLGARF